MKIICVIVIFIAFTIPLLMHRPDVPDGKIPENGHVFTEGIYSFTVDYPSFELVDIQMNPGSLTLSSSKFDFCITKTRKGYWIYREFDGRAINQILISKTDEIAKIFYETSNKHEYKRIQRTWFPSYLDSIIKKVMNWI